MTIDFVIISIILALFGVLFYGGKVYQGIRNENEGEEYPDHKWNVFFLIYWMVVLFIISISAAAIN